ncbi:MAG: MFS transporter [Candidatus Methanomethyliaceae archaeon]|nr:MFS transporter [Candidatus Methanomethyliaceae archaeon]
MNPLLFRFYIGVFSISLGFGIMTPAVPLFATLKFSANEWELGIIGTLVALPYFFAPFLFGKMSDRVGRRPLILSGILVYFFTSFMYVISTSIHQIAILRIFEGISFSMIWPSTEAFVGDFAKHLSRNRAIGLYSVAWSSGYMLGSMTMGLMVYFIDLTHLFFVVGFIMLVGICAFFSLNIKNSDLEEISTDKPSRSLVISVSYVMLIWGVSVLSFFSLFPSYATKKGVSPSMIGYLIGIVGLVRTLVFFFFSRIMAIMGSATMPIGMALLSLSMLILWLAPSEIGLLASVSLLGLSLGLLYAYSLLLMLSLPSRGRYAGIFESSIGLGELVGPIIMGYMGFVISPSFPYICLSILGLISSIVSFLLITCGQKKLFEVS